MTYSPFFHSSIALSPQVQVSVITFSYTHNSRYDSPGRVIGPSQRFLPDDITLIRDRHLCPGGVQTHSCSKRSATGIGRPYFMSTERDAA
jgi:hypothetical protein